MKPIRLLLMSTLLFLLGSCATQVQKNLGDTPPSGEALVGILNTAIQSDFVQDYEFVIEEGCTPSVLNDLEFCNAVKSKNDITTSVVDQACVDACNAAYDVCHGGCSAVDWTCNDCCTKECKKARDGCKDLCGYLDVKIGYYLYQVENAKGLGNLTVTSVTDPVVMPNDSTLFTVDIDMNVPSEVSARIYYEFEVDGLPAIKDHMTLTTTGVTAKASGELIPNCNGDYYIQLTDMTVTIPDNVFDSNTLTQIADALMISVDQLTFGVVDLETKLLNSLNNTVAKETMKALNDVLDNSCDE
jgi:hypothetical protein